VDVVVCEGAAISNRVEAEEIALFKSSSIGEICTTVRKQTSALKFAGLTKVSVKSPQPRRQKSLFQKTKRELHCKNPMILSRPDQIDTKTSEIPNQCLFTPLRNGNEFNQTHHQTLPDDGVFFRCLQVDFESQNAKSSSI